MFKLLFGLPAVKSGSTVLIAIMSSLTINSKKQLKWYSLAKSVRRFSEKICLHSKKQMNIAHIVITNMF